MMDVKYNPKMQIIVDMIHTLYDLPDCSCGGCCHIVTDDDNIEDDNLKFVINYCKEPDNTDCVDKELSSMICELMLQLTYEQRVCLFVMMNDGYCDDGINKSIWDEYFGIYTAEEVIKEWEGEDVPIDDDTIVVPEDKKIQDILVESADISDIINNPLILYDMFLKVESLNNKFNKLKKESCFIWNWKHPNFLHLVLWKSNVSTHRFSLAGAIRMYDELLNITPTYTIPEECSEEYYSNPLFIKFVEVYREQLFRFIHHINLGNLIQTKREFMIYCPNISKDEFIRLYRKYNIPKGDDVEWDPKEQCYRSTANTQRRK